MKLRLYPYCTGWFYVAPQKAIWYSMSSNGLWRHKSLTTNRTSCRSGWPRGLGALNSSPHFWIFTSVSVGSSPRPYVFTSATVRIVFTQQQSITMAQNLSEMWRSTFKIGAAQLHSVTEIAPPQLKFLCVNRSPIWYGFRLAAQKVSVILWSARASYSLSWRGLSTRIRRLWDTGFEVLDLRTSGHFQFKSKLEDSPSKALNYLNLQSMTLRQEQVSERY